MSKTWISDASGNRCSVEYWGTKEAARHALDSLKRCSDCSDCSNCSNCSRCSNCSNCSDCSNCSNCSRCSNCSNCSNCSRCSRCSGCYSRQNMKAVAPGEANAGPPPVPVINNIHAVIYAAASAPGSLEMGDVHTCEKTHCRGGWAIALAGAAGFALQDFYNWELAAMMIYDASAPGFKINPARFFDSNEDALADMKHLADRSAE